MSAWVDFPSYLILGTYLSFCLPTSKLAFFTSFAHESLLRGPIPLSNYRSRADLDEDVFVKWKVIIA